jgi:hypothetical protein
MSQLKYDVALLRDFKNLNNKDKLELLERLNTLTLLTPAVANTKTAKNDGEKYLSYIMHLAPSDVSGFDVCPKASQGCRAACLNTSGRGRFESTQLARIRKTLFFIHYRQEFLTKLNKEIGRAQRKAEKLGKTCVVRLNGTSDIAWETIKLESSNKSVIELNPNVQFYDYTKRHERLKRVNMPSNYDLTFSMAEDNSESALAALDCGYRVAVVFKTIPSEYLGIKCINGDNTDLRFLDPKQCFVGLNAKGKAKQDESGFVK